MYKFINTSDNTTIAYSDTVLYIRLSKNGCYVPSDKENAQGIAVNGTPYSLDGKLEGLDEAIVTEVDSGAELVYVFGKLSSTEDILTQTQLALCDVYEQALDADSQLTSTQLALCDVYEQLIALTSVEEGGEVSR